MGQPYRQLNSLPNPVTQLAKILAMKKGMSKALAALHKENQILLDQYIKEYLDELLPCNVLHTSCGHALDCSHHDQKMCSCNRSHYG